MKQQGNKKVIIRASALAAAAFLGILGSQYMANQIKTDRVAATQSHKASESKAAEPVQKDADQKAAQSPNSAVETEYVYDDKGNVVIAPENPQSSASVNKPTNNSVPQFTATPSGKSSDPDKAVDNKGNNNTSSAGTGSSTKSGSTTSTPAAAPDKSTNNGQSSSSGKSGNTSSSGNSSGKGSGTKTVYVEGFGDVVVPEGNQSGGIQGEYQGGDHNKQVGY